MSEWRSAHAVPNGWTASLCYEGDRVVRLAITPPPGTMFTDVVMVAARVLIDQGVKWSSGVWEDGAGRERIFVLRA